MISIVPRRQVNREASTMDPDTIQPTIRRARDADADAVASLLDEAEEWLRRRGPPMWRDSELTLDCVLADVHAGLVFVALSAGVVVASLRFQLEDREFWPDLPGGDSAFVHRLVVRRANAGQGLSTKLLQWAVGRARDLGRRFVRLDCEASRTRLRAIYERFGFTHHSDRQVGPYFVSRYEYRLLLERTPNDKA